LLAKRIIPCLDVKDGRVVKGTQFLNLIDAGDPVELGRRYSNDGADELVFLDITANIEKRTTITKLVRSVASELDIPFTVGGGINTLEEARSVLLNGADKTSVNTAAVMRPEFISEIASTFGAQCCVIAIDTKRNNSPKQGVELIDTPDGSCWFEVYVSGGHVCTGLDALTWVKKAVQLGAGEVMLTSMDRDGSKLGYDLELIAEVTQRVNVPVIASGGAGELHHFEEAFTAGADAALAASIFHYESHPIPKVKEYLRKHGVNVR
jgi:imidazole glycerol-phosphate synthase subunit HisF